MRIRLQSRLVLGGVLGFLLVVSVGAALQLSEIVVLIDELLASDSIANAEAAAALEGARTDVATAALGLAFVAASTLIGGAWLSRAARVNLHDRLVLLERAAKAISTGEHTRRVGLAGDDELAAVSRALDLALDLRDRGEAAASGRNRELRALLIALLRRWSRPAGITGIDGELLVSTLTAEQEGVLRSLAPQFRAAARTLISRKFVSAGDLATDIRVQSGHVVYLRALALGDKRIVGWLAVFGKGDAIEREEGRGADQLGEG